MIDETRYTETEIHTETRPRFSVSPGYVPAVAAEVIEYGRTSAPKVAGGPIGAGVVVAIAVQAILAVLGMAIGLSVAHTQTAGAATSTEGLGVGAGIWWVLTGMISLFLGGWTAGWMAAPLNPSIGGLH